ncbi:MAG: amidase [Vicinamibacterales bacterium]|nr:amidase [Acidobacteriota bacterium]MDP6374116.1 amidase [Vicinamibacterales bacterium]MDP6608182.1 amidase [Vicinamibacterales bacterium]HAK57015.1 amidase [Acidobacteriota bacterium]|tara:strand:+ start:625 stop:2370 length:1746 start_codon:yes stop_codon:yes gene_type:complete
MSGKGNARRGTIGRRGFLRVAPAALASGLVAPKVAAQAEAEPVATSAIEGTEAVAGLDFMPAEQAMMQENLGRRLDDYAELREFDVPLDTEPAVTFTPHLPGRAPVGDATPGARLRLSQIEDGPIDVPTSLEDLAFLPVRGLASLIERRAVTSTALTEMYLNRLRRHGDTLHCVVTLTDTLALEQARRADAEIAAGRYRGPLHGIPWGAKDLLATRGIKTTWGAKPYEYQVIDVDATVVERLAEAGAVLVAKLSMGALALGGVWFGGSTRNPWNLERSSSGSSAGPGAATAAGLVGFSIGTETRGSIISPSAACGVTGLRPTYGRVSRYGAMALSWTMDKIGPMCRSVEDCALVFNAIYGPDGRDGTVTGAPFDWTPEPQLAGLRIGYLRDEFERIPDDLPEDQRAAREAQRTALAAALEALRGAGATLEPIAMPEMSSNAIGFVLTTEAAAAFDDLTRSRGIDQLTSQSPRSWPNTFRSGRFVPAVEYLRAQRIRTLLQQRMEALMADYDLFVSPSRSGSLGITNLTGHPAVALKAGFADGMPVSLMFTGRLYGEATVLRAALAYERATPWHNQHPSLEG